MSSVLPDNGDQTEFLGARGHFPKSQANSTLPLSTGHARSAVGPGCSRAVLVAESPSSRVVEEQRKHF